ncbi:MAG: glycosyltransferase family 4 protein [Burkholderiaceae bacterium]|nr:glycosyltransferase family 4 protein [Microbacteriaceae bacterium]
MKVLFDCRYTRLVRHDGISRYSAGLVGAFAKLHPVTMLISDERQLAMLPDLPWVRIPAGTSALEPWIALWINREKPDVVFSPMHTMGSAHRRYRLILTLHDLVFYRIHTPPRDYSWYVRLIWWAYHLSYVPGRLVLDRAEAIVTGSHNCADEMSAVRLTRRPVTVVHPGVDSSGLPARVHSAARTLIYMGTFLPNKNVETLVRAMHLLPGYRLHLLSRIDDETRARLSAAAPADSLVFENGVSDERYLELLRTCTAMVSACRDEGFGIPLIEALASATPLVISDIPVFREVGGTAATYFAPDDAEQFARSVLAIDTAEVWDALSAASLVQAAAFTWEESATELLRLVQTLPPRNRPRWHTLRSGRRTAQGRALPRQS